MTTKRVLHVTHVGQFCDACFETLVKEQGFPRSSAMPITDECPNIRSWEHDACSTCGEQPFASEPVKPDSQNT